MLSCGLTHKRKVHSALQHEQFFVLFFHREHFFGEAIQPGIVSKEPVINKYITVTVRSLISHPNAWRWTDGCTGLLCALSPVPDYYQTAASEEYWLARQPKKMNILLSAVLSINSANYRFISTRSFPIVMVTTNPGGTRMLHIIQGSKISH